MNLKKTISMFLLLAVGSIIHAHDFAVTSNGQKLYFNITSENKLTVEVSYYGSIKDKKPSYSDGEVLIPAKVKHEGKVYIVKGIGKKAFSGADKLTGITLPSGLEYVDDFAFEGCTSLSRIIFPGNVVTFGEGVFFKCDKIQDVSLGSDWTSVDLQMFRWSNMLNVITIPAKIEKIKNIKSLKYLETIFVDLNNSHFSVYDGALYNKSGETLYGCPRSHKSGLEIKEGTVNITKGALIDCYKLSEVDFPSTLKNMSFMELSRLTGLKNIVFRSLAPVMTADSGSEEVFLLQLACPEAVKIYVPKKSAKIYKKELINDKGDFVEIGGDKFIEAKEEMMPSSKSIKGVKKFQK